MLGFGGVMRKNNKKGQQKGWGSGGWESKCVWFLLGDFGGVDSYL